MKNPIKFVFTCDATKFILHAVLPLAPHCCIFRPAFGCCALQMQVEICVFNVFSAQKCSDVSKTLDQCLVQTSRTCFLQDLFLHFLVFKQKNVKNAYFNQRLECAVPKHWSKYTTPHN